MKSKADDISEAYYLMRRPHTERGKGGKATRFTDGLIATPRGMIQFISARFADGSGQTIFRFIHNRVLETVLYPKFFTETARLEIAEALTEKAQYGKK